MQIIKYINRMLFLEKSWYKARALAVVTFVFFPNQ